MKCKMSLIISVCLIVFVVAQKPSDRLDVTNWKITMPYNTAAIGGNPDEIYQPDLKDWVDDKHYYINPNGEGVVFMAHCGAATTINSSYPRSEFREMRMDDNTDEASWSTGDSKIHKMEIIQAITNTPVVKPHVVAGQIHASGDDLTVFRLEGKKLFVDLNGDDGPVLTNNYTTGDVFKVAFIAGNGKVTYEYNGEPVRDDDGDIFELKCNESKCYFKAGCYTQSNVDKGDEPDAYGEVIIYSFFVSHGDEIHTEHSSNTPIISSTPSSVNGTTNSIRTEIHITMMKVHLTLSEPQPVAVSLLRANGSLLQRWQKSIKGAGNYCESISLEDFTNGIYLVRVTMNSNSFIEPVVLMR